MGADSCIFLPCPPVGFVPGAEQGLGKGHPRLGSRLGVRLGGSGAACHLVEQGQGIVNLGGQTRGRVIRAACPL